MPGTGDKLLFSCLAEMLTRSVHLLQCWHLSLTDLPFPSAAEQTLPTRGTVLARLWVRVWATRLLLLLEAARVLLGGYIKEVLDGEQQTSPSRTGHST